MLESTARTLVVEQLEAELLSTLRDELPELLEAAVDDLSRSLSRLGVELNTGFMGTPTLDLSFLIEPERLALVPGWVAQALASWTIERTQDSDQSEIVVRGVPALAADRALRRQGVEARVPQPQRARACRFVSARGEHPREGGTAHTRAPLQHIALCVVHILVMVESESCCGMAPRS